MTPDDSKFGTPPDGKERPRMAWQVVFALGFACGLVFDAALHDLVKYRARQAVERAQQQVPPPIEDYCADGPCSSWMPFKTGVAQICNPVSPEENESLRKKHGDDLGTVYMHCSSMWDQGGGEVQK